MSNLVFDLNKDKKVSTADVVYFASALIDKEHYNMNLNQQVVSVDGLMLQKVFNKLQESDNVKVDANYTIINEFTSSLITFSANSSYLINLNVNYLTSLLPDLYIQLKLCYEISGVETKFAETKLGTCNTSFLRSNYNYSSIIDISSEANDTIFFKLYAKYINENNNDIDLELDSKPEIILEFLGNNLSIIEIKNV